MSNKPEILIIDDEATIRKLLDITLQSNEFIVKLAGSAGEGLIMASNHPPDLILLDLGLPDFSGHIVLEKLRQWYTNPIIILSVQNSENDIIKSLDNGANDYLVKPFRTGELLARIRSALRSNTGIDSGSAITCNELQFDLTSRTVKKNNEILKLTATEYTLLILLLKNEGTLLTHQYLLREVWGPGFISQSQYLRVFIARLRKKIETDANRPKYILTESGIGYRFVSEQ